MPNVLTTDNIAQTALLTKHLQYTVSLETMVDILKKEFVTRFFVRGRNIDNSQTNRLLNWLGQAAMRKCTPKTHFFPCHLMNIQEPDELKVGPIIFRTRKSFYKHYKERIRECSLKNSEKYDRNFLAATLHYYRGFRWIAEVPVAAADADKSRKIAMDAARAAINVLCVIFGAHATDEMQVGGPRITGDTRGHLSLKEGDNALDVETSYKWGGGNSFSKGWANDIDGSDTHVFLTHFGVALEVAVNPNLKRPLSQRVLDAIYWFGEAVRETSHAARVVKYATALERLLMTSEHDDITKYVSQRCAAFCCIYDRSKKLDEFITEITKFYDLRSRLVHGDLSPLDQNVFEGARAGSRLSRDAILSVVHHLGRDGSLMSENVPNSRLAKWPVPGFEDTELGVFMEPEDGHGTTEVYARVQG